MYQIYGEKCCGQRQPKGLTMRPDFSWRLRGGREENQETYRIKVFGEKEELLWDSGERKGREVHRIPYEGPALCSAKDYSWQVESVSTKGERAFSEKRFFTTGILAKEEWKAKWIEADFLRRPLDDVLESYKIFTGQMPYREKPEETLNPCLYFRKEILVGKGLKKAKLFATAHGIYEAYVNGMAFGSPLAPGYTKYTDYQECQCYDVTGALKEGENVLGAIVADGWYTGKVGLMGVGNQYGETTALFMQLMLEYKDGTRKVIGSDEGFVSGPGAYLFADLFVGEGYDASKEPEGWMEPGYENPLWKPVIVKDYGVGQLTGAADEPAAVIRCQKAKALFDSPKGERILDVGENIAGYVSLNGVLKKGEKITLEYCEVLDKEGNFLRNIIGQNKNQTDVYIAGKDGAFSYCPKFTFHGFQYVKITGADHLTLDDFRVHVLASDLERTGTFRCSDERLNQLQENTFRSQQGNMLYVPTDCPQREKAGWTGDMQAYTPTAAYLMDVEAFLSKWLSNMRLEQVKDGRVPDVIPMIPSNHLISEGGEICSSGWGDACVIIPYRLYHIYGDAKILRENYPMMLRWMAYIEEKAASEVPKGVDVSDPVTRECQKYLWNTGVHYGDWLIPSLSSRGVSDPRVGAEMTKGLTAPAMFAYTCTLMAEISDVLGEEEKAEHFKFLKGKIKEAYTHEYLLPDDHLTIDYQGMYVLALQMDLVPKERREGVLNRLTELIEENGGCLDTGFLSMPFLLDVLYDNGRKEEAYRLLFQEKCPSWLYEVKMGANTIWESWNNIREDGTRSSSSYNHFAFGCVGDFLYRRVLGLQCLEPGYRKVRIEPDLSCGLTWAEGSFESIYGKISVCWEQQDGEAVLKVELPPSVCGEIVFGDNKRTIDSGRYLFRKNG